MEINRVRLFCTICETDNLRKAAEFHGMSPGALSKSMKQLEHELDTKLIIPAGRGLAITDDGREIYTAGQSLIQEYERFLSSTKSSKHQDRPLRIGSFEVFTTHFLGHALQSFLPDLEVFASETTPGEIESSLIEHRLDVGITYAPVPHAELDFLKVTNFEFAIFGRRDRFGKVPFLDLPFAIPITPIRGFPTNIQGLDAWPEAFPRKIKYRFELLETALDAARKGLAVLFCPEFVIKLQNESLKPEYRLTRLPSPAGMKSVKQHIYLVKRKSSIEDQNIKKLARALRSLVAGGENA
jgi:DNA-binding transcriptional LysR family regulator